MNIPVISIMIKDEEKTICETLKPFVDSGYKKYYIYDTGSTDNTIEVVSKFLSDNEVDFIIGEEPFINFSESRNRLIDLVKINFPTYKFFIMLDCEWYIVNANKLLVYCNEISDEDFDHYSIDVHSGNVFGHYRLFRMSGSSRFSGPVHEYVTNGTSRKLPNDVYFNYSPSEYGCEKSKKRHSRDLTIIENFLETNRDPRYVFYLAQTYECLGEKEKALKYYNERYEMKSGFSEERYISLLRSGKILTGLNVWPMALECYLKAYSIRPSRIESLVYIAKHYDSNELYLKYHYSKLACEAVYPYNDMLFIENYMYNYERWNQLSISAWYFNEFEEGYKATLKALEYSPQDHLFNNLRLYKSKINNITESLDRRFDDKIINLILYSEDVHEYIEMRNILSNYLREKGIKYYFYTYKPELETDFLLDDDILYIKGEETFIPGILDKTIKALEYINEFDYDYIIRSNISTIVNFGILKYYLRDLDYSGALYYSGSFVDTKSGLNEEQNQKYESYGFASGTCIILSKKSVNCIIKNQNELREYGIIDDVAIGVLLESKAKEYELISKKFGNKLLFCKEDNYTNKNYISYRIKSENRRSDCEMMNLITTILGNDTI